MDAHMARGKDQALQSRQVDNKEREGWKLRP